MTFQQKRKRFLALCDQVHVRRRPRYLESTHNAKSGNKRDKPASSGAVPLVDLTRGSLARGERQRETARKKERERGRRLREREEGEKEQIGCKRLVSTRLDLERRKHEISFFSAVTLDTILPSLSYCTKLFYMDLLQNIMNKVSYYLHPSL